MPNLYWFQDYMFFFRMYPANTPSRYQHGPHMGFPADTRRFLSAGSRRERRGLSRRVPMLSPDQNPPLFHTSCSVPRIPLTNFSLHTHTLPHPPPPLHHLPLALPPAALYTWSSFDHIWTWCYVHKHNVRHPSHSMTSLACMLVSRFNNNDRFLKLRLVQ